MLVNFNSEVGGFIMSRDIAVQLLKAMGHSGTVPSAILPEDIPRALARLKAAVEAAPRSAQAPPVESGSEELPVSLRQRAFPLVELLTRAAHEEVEVLWK